MKRRGAGGKADNASPKILFTSASLNLREDGRAIRGHQRRITFGGEVDGPEWVRDAGGPGRTGI